jgi:small GTP-binding protein
MSGVRLGPEDDPVAVIAGMREIGPVLALLGNPNVGKSSLFNRLTGIGVETAHYPGTTQAMNVGDTRAGERRAVIIDLPGTYSLSDQAAESAVTRRALVELLPDAAVVVVDATNLARNLYLLIQTIDLGLPLVVALNLVDEAEHKGFVIDAGVLEARLGVPVLPPPVWAWTPSSTPRSLPPRDVAFPRRSSTTRRSRPFWSRWSLLLPGSQTGRADCRRARLRCCSSRVRRTCSGSRGTWRTWLERLPKRARRVRSRTANRRR